MKNVSGYLFFTSEYSPPSERKSCVQGTRQHGEPKRTRREKRKIPTGIPLEQLIPAPLIVTIRLALAIAVDTSESWRRAEKSVWSVEDKRWSRRSEGGIVFRKGGREDKPPVVYVTGCQPRRERERGKCEQARGRRRSKKKTGRAKVAGVVL